MNANLVSAGRLTDEPVAYFVPRHEITPFIERLWLRLTWAMAAFICVYLAIAVRLVVVSSFQGEETRSYALHRAKPLPGITRRDIVDRNGLVLATNVSVASVFADPQQVRDLPDTIHKLQSVFPDLSRSYLQSRLSSKQRFVWIKRNITPREQFALNQLGIAGIDYRREERRIYPQGHLFSHVLGYVDVDNDGVAGMEKSFESFLDDTESDAEPLQLSLDVRVQEILIQQLQENMEVFQAKGGAGLVLDVKTGELIAMASLPDFDPHHPMSVDADARFNRNTLGVYELGSTFKSFTFAMALDSGRVKMADSFDASHPLQYASHTIHDSHPKSRWLNVAESYMYSSNIATARVLMQTGMDHQKEFLGRMGMLKPIELELPEIGAPIIPNQWGGIRSITASFGHGISVTPVHLARATAALVNGGKLLPVTLLKGVNGNEPEGEQVITAATSESMRYLMRLVVEQGTARKASSKAYAIGGKTGTSEKVVGGRYAHNKLLTSFVGVFPMQDPRYLVVTVMDEPVGTKETYGYATAGYTTAPVAGRIISRIGPLLGVAPHPLPPLPVVGAEHVAD
jgi:cell division protein FtsI (penicillin-binding protein 3)